MGKCDYRYLKFIVIKLCVLIQCNGKDISWSHLVKLYHRNRSADSPGLAMITKLKYEHVWPTSYSKMRVDLAAQVIKVEFKLRQYETYCV